MEKALATFSGVERRLSLLGTAQDDGFLSDFAHHPTAIAEVLGGLPDTYPGHRIVAVFEPRSWSLRRNFFQDRLPDALAGADEIVIKDVFEKEKIPAGERLSIAALSADLRGQGQDGPRLRRLSRRSRGISGRLDLSRRQVVILLSNGDVRDLYGLGEDPLPGGRRPRLTSNAAFR